MNDPVLDIRADDVDTGRIVAEIRGIVADRTRAGDYRDPRIARAERSNLANLRHADEFWEFYLESLQESVQVDINDFDISERRAAFGPVLVAFKRLVWKLLKFYTYRLWSQQNQVNALVLAAVSGTREGLQEKIRALERRLETVEKENAARTAGTPKSGT